MIATVSAMSTSGRNSKKNKKSSGRLGGKKKKSTKIANGPRDPLTLDRTVGGELVRVRPSPKHGLGVFAARDIPAGVVVHLAPVILVDDDDVQAIDQTALSGLVYGWEVDGDMAAFALGIGSLFNHDQSPNCAYHRVDEGDLDTESGDVHPFDALEYSTIRAVVEGEELTVDYSGGDPSILWFDPI